MVAMINPYSIVVTPGEAPSHLRQRPPLGGALIKAHILFNKYFIRSRQMNTTP